MSTDTPRNPEQPSGPPPLNKEQRTAIEHGSGPLMVLAGAGTGKTRVLVHRIARLVETGVPPWAVLAVTFTNKAADEMRHRLRGLLGDAADAMWIGTFHAICARILRRLGAHVGLTRGFVIFDEDDQLKIIEKILDESGSDEQLSPRAVTSRIDRLKNRGVRPANLAQRELHAHSDHATEQRPVSSANPASAASIDEAAERVYPLYQARLTRENAVDFNDLILLTLDLFDHEQAARALGAQFMHVLVDEFQDTNEVQYRLVQRLAQTRNLTVVGDDDQSIYAWRGAEPKNLLEFDRDFPDARVVKLEQNYRSTQTILDSANRVIRRNVQRHGKSLWSDRGVGPRVLAHQADDERGEARFVAQAARRLIEESVATPGQIAVLYRTNAQSRVLEEHLHAARVPARVVGGTSFFERREVRDVVAYLRLIANPGADSALERIVNVPPRGLGEKTIQRVAAIARVDGVSMLEAVRRAGSGSGASGIGPAPRAKLRSFAETIDALRGLVDAKMSVPDVVIQVIGRSGLRERLESDRSDESNARLENLADLVTMAIDFRDEVDRDAKAKALASPAAKGADDGTPPELGSTSDDETSTAATAGATAATATVVGFLERMALASPSDGTRTDDAVVLTTIHVAKGLEWPVVFVTGMEDGLFPSLRPRDEVDEEAALEEERRLAYVAITRARDRLFLSHALTRRVWGDVRVQRPSRFLDDALGPPETTVRSGRWPWG